jgi:hypothetical protein
LYAASASSSLPAWVRSSAALKLAWSAAAPAAAPAAPARAARAELLELDVLQVGGVAEGDAAARQAGLIAFLRHRDVVQPGRQADLRELALLVGLRLELAGHAALVVQLDLRAFDRLPLLVDHLPSRRPVCADAVAAGSPNANDADSRMNARFIRPSTGFKCLTPWHS